MQELFCIGKNKVNDVGISQETARGSDGSTASSGQGFKFVLQRVEQNIQAGTPVLYWGSIVLSVVTDSWTRYSIEVAHVNIKIPFHPIEGSQGGFYSANIYAWLKSDSLVINKLLILGSCRVLISICPILNFKSTSLAAKHSWILLTLGKKIYVNKIEIEHANTVFTNFGNIFSIQKY